MEREASAENVAALLPQLGTDTAGSGRLVRPKGGPMKRAWKGKSP